MFVGHTSGFLKSNILLVGVLLFSWYVWQNPEKWGVLPFVGFVVSYFLLFERIYYFFDRLSDKLKKLIKKSLLLLAPGIIGLCLWDWWGWSEWGIILAFISLCGFIWKFPTYYGQIYAHAGSIRKILILLSVLVVCQFVGTYGYSSYQYENAVRSLENESVRLKAIVALGEIARENESKYGKIITLLSYTAREISPWREGKQSQPNPDAIHIAHMLGSLQKNRLKIDPYIDLQATDLRGADLQH
jgi:hypothetical protein